MELNSGKEMIVAAFQANSRKGDIQANLSYAFRRLDDLAEKDVDLVCFPELWNTGYSNRARLFDLAEPIPGPTTDALSKKATEYGIYVIVGIDERGEEKGIIYDSAALIGPNGDVIGKYRKTHLATERETRYFTAGDEYPVFNTTIGNLAVMICYDMGYFPEVARIYALKGAEIIFCPCAWGEWGKILKRSQSRASVNRLMASSIARAIENRLFLVTSNRADQEYDEESGEIIEFSGHSSIVDPTGQVLVELSSGDGTAICRIDLSTVSALRKQVFHGFNPLTDRRPETYSLLLGRATETLR